VLRKWGDLCHGNSENLALMLTLEIGKKMAERRREMLWCEFSEAIC